MWAILYSVVVDWLITGLLVAFTCSYLANKHLRQHHSHSVEQEVEWLFAFDVHANAYFCGFLVTQMLHVRDHNLHLSIYSSYCANVSTFCCRC